MPRSASFRLRRLLPLLGFLLGSLFVRAGDADEVALAQARLGPDVPSWRLELRNTRRASAYPRTTHALVFAWGDALWFYCPADGTQSLSRFRGRVDEDRADLLPLLRRIEPGFASYRELPATPFDAPVDPKAWLRNGCFIESLAFARGLAETPDALGARLVSLYSELHGRVHGHTVVWFTRADGDYLFDVDDSPRIRRVRLPAGAAAMDVAREVAADGRRGRLARAVQLRVGLPGPAAVTFATDARGTATDGRAGTVIR